MIELGVLGLLKDRQMHGYQLSQELAEQVGGVWRVSYGSLYPTLRRLERDGAIERVPGEGGSRRKTVYRITPEGERLFLRLLEEAPQDGASEDTRFRLRLAFFRYLPPETRIRLMERRQESLEERLEQIKASAGGPAGRGDDYQRALIEHGRAATETDIAWLEALIHRERRRYGITAPVGERRRAQATLRRKEHSS